MLIVSFISFIFIQFIFYFCYQNEFSAVSKIFIDVCVCFILCLFFFAISFRLILFLKNTFPAFYFPSLFSNDQHFLSLIIFKLTVNFFFSSSKKNSKKNILYILIFVRKKDSQINKTFLF